MCYSSHHLILHGILPNKKKRYMQHRSQYNYQTGKKERNQKAGSSIKSDCSWQTMNFKLCMAFCYQNYWKKFCSDLGFQRLFLSVSLDCLYWWFNSSILGAIKSTSYENSIELEACFKEMRCTMASSPWAFLPIPLCSLFWRALAWDVILLDAHGFSFTPFLVQWWLCIPSGGQQSKDIVQNVLGGSNLMRVEFERENGNQGLIGRHSICNTCKKMKLHQDERFIQERWKQNGRVSVFYDDIKLPSPYDKVFDTHRSCMLWQNSCAEWVDDKWFCSHIVSEVAARFRSLGSPSGCTLALSMLLMCYLCNFWG